MERTTLTGFMT